MPTDERATSTPHPLELRGVSLAYGGLVALSSVDLTVPVGQVTGLIGSNGAGKTSLFDVVTGLARPSRGTVLLHGRDITNARLARRARLGLGRTFQRLELFASLTVGENIAVAAEAAHPARLRPHRRHLWSSEAGSVVAEQLDRVGLTDHASARVDTLSTGLARLVEVARALAARPSVLLLDEPASGLDGEETAQLAAVLGALASDGLAVLLVEHDVELVMQVCTSVVVLDRGEVLASGTPIAVRQDPLVREAYLGQLAVS
ncbi:MAG: ABC transporter ATP-binding protein [Acidimicrobiales bacterium]|jgi:branched-chain amino acid transport system ATP-binding protein